MWSPWGEVRHCQCLEGEWNAWLPVNVELNKAQQLAFGKAMIRYSNEFRRSHKPARYPLIEDALVKDEDGNRDDFLTQLA